MPVPPGSNSHQCVLRALCEVAKTPQNQDGLLGDFINLLLTPTYILDHLSKTQDSDYLEAQRKGHFLQDCSSYEHSCPLSLFEVIQLISHYLKSQIFVQKFNFDKTRNSFTSFSPKFCFDNFSREIKVVNS